MFAPATYQAPDAAIACISADGLVFAVCDEQSLLVHGGRDEAPIFQRTLDAPIIALAVRLDPHTVMSLADPPTDTIVQLGYVDKSVLGLGFGPGPVLGVGLSGGDGNYVDIAKKQLRRTDTFEGRPHNRWAVSVTINPEALPASARPPSEAAAAAPPLQPSSPPAANVVASAGGSSTLRTALLVALCIIGIGGAAYLKVSSEQQQQKEESDREMRERIERNVSDSVQKSLKKQRE